MQGSSTDRTSKGPVVNHPLDPEDAPIAAAMRAMVRSAKGARPGAEARGHKRMKEHGRLKDRADAEAIRKALAGTPE